LFCYAHSSNTRSNKGSHFSSHNNRDKS
jgi:hypothetical protein